MARSLIFSFDAIALDHPQWFIEQINAMRFMIHRRLLSETLSFLGLTNQTLDYSVFLKYPIQGHDAVRYVIDSPSVADVFFVDSIRLAYEDALRHKMPLGHPVTIVAFVYSTIIDYEEELISLADELSGLGISIVVFAYKTFGNLAKLNSFAARFNGLALTGFAEIVSFSFGQLRQSFCRSLPMILMKIRRECPVFGPFLADLYIAAIGQPVPVEIDPIDHDNEVMLNMDFHTEVLLEMCDWIELFEREALRIGVDPELYSDYSAERGVENDSDYDIEYNQLLAEMGTDTGNLEELDAIDLEFDGNTEASGSLSGGSLTEELDGNTEASGSLSGGNLSEELERLDSLFSDLEL